MQASIAPYAVVLAFALAAIGLGGGIYETRVVDRVWPGNIKLIQPQSGGIDRKMFWMPVHTTFELMLIVSIWAAWPLAAARHALLAALAIHAIGRGWSFAYFIPRALAFEKTDVLTPELTVRARNWVRFSVLRIPLSMATVAALAVALFAIRG
jgi:hypothetical protein